MDWAVAADVLITIAVVSMFALCALMMLSMMVRGWLRGGRHWGHGMMMCMGHGADDEPLTRDKGLVEELKAERERLDALIARAEREAGARKDLGEA